uniref:JmjC domain-containing protein n=1 Tax=Mycena chlorophos TaxID=658473 RepID=A0ABQ0L5Q4_MYCCL|nr:predicted protein [Mycena chlorophos]
MRWGIAGNKGVTSAEHIDTGGHTYLIVQNDDGAKGWMVVNERRLRTAMDGQRGAWYSRRMTEKPEGGDEENPYFEYEGILLHKGMILIQRPCLWHRVIGMANCVILGGHGHSIFAIDRSIAGELHTVFAGDFTTNTDHAPARWLYIRILELQIDNITHNEPDEHTLDLKSSEDLEKFGAYDIDVPEAHEGSLPIPLEQFLEFAHLWSRIGEFEDWVAASAKFVCKTGVFSTFRDALDDAIVQMACCCVRYMQNPPDIEDDVSEDEVDSSGFTADTLTDCLVRTMAAFDYTRRGGMLAAFVFKDRQSRSGLAKRFADAVESDEEFPFFLDWTRADRPPGAAQVPRKTMPIQFV